ncbi:MAG: acyl carrier protein [Bacteroidia bacterium]|nr:acyl carrier protein [Bacteroidia bacterium]
MEESAFIENVKNQFIDSNEIELTIDSDFRKIESYDSLTGMTIIVMLKDEYGVDISETDYKSKKTVRELYDYVILMTKP